METAMKIKLRTERTIIGKLNTKPPIQAPCPSKASARMSTKPPTRTKHTPTIDTANIFLLIDIIPPAKPNAKAIIPNIPADRMSYRNVQRYDKDDIKPPV